MEDQLPNWNYLHNRVQAADSYQKMKLEKVVMGCGESTNKYLSSARTSVSGYRKCISMLFAEIELKEHLWIASTKGTTRTFLLIR